ncbi:hypothetical protein CW354_08115 [Marinicaulis flavus]|uniref:Uncharacterized protein n=1 Tax=Hyphococcus luteus TaxID=2058213 RepID=A0A2S7K6W1_9PROT|nr:hypothetical protein CW354_08115 [Marinicaulis flavus]
MRILWMVNRIADPAIHERMGKADSNALIDGRVHILTFAFADRMPAGKLRTIALAEIPACSQDDVMQIDIPPITDIHPMIFIRLGRRALDATRKAGQNAQHK